MNAVPGAAAPVDVRYVAFFRNVNQGQRGHPSTADLLGALGDAGGRDAVAFQSNGTVVFTDAPASGIAGDIPSALLARSGVEREVFVMALDEIAMVVAAHAGAPDAPRLEVTLHRGGVLDIDDAAVAEEAAVRRCRVVGAGPGWVVSANERDRESNATPVVERLTGAPATSRGLPTLIRLADRFAR
ncbi:DUF1697 domain-containing protein [Microbacterium thalassium]|uniref:DUF1697 domain-containing protein n=1 Tax=Microbacterium TaxID=33882 RepID=UPI0014699EF5|nr:DUF1697 domain-containing protein [Microbacterium thalassium]